MEKIGRVSQSQYNRTRSVPKDMEGRHELLLAIAARKLPSRTALLRLEGDHDVPRDLFKM